jgi:hypothetical protein
MSYPKRKSKKYSINCRHQNLAKKSQQIFKKLKQDRDKPNKQSQKLYQNDRSKNVGNSVYGRIIGLITLINMKIVFPTSSIIPIVYSSLTLDVKVQRSFLLVFFRLLKGLRRAYEEQGVDHYNQLCSTFSFAYA